MGVDMGLVSFAVRLEGRMWLWRSLHNGRQSALIAGGQPFHSV
jgi:hypothetical protein